MEVVITQVADVLAVEVADITQQVADSIQAEAADMLSPRPQLQLALVLEGTGNKPDQIQRCEESEIQKNTTCYLETLVA
ncbi:unnamed protein product [Acanthoscelides obtectus]|uniref:Uncharacterized protein n=1 Tax=Acanthoscelides obtectus TaxID=200917 RepID=A0A9P0M3W8_ACAOB|nr:unnamed protein product [Acanthoscelides obtectus]CAK1664379.1 hypothetical protein AOBTE_LOCUS24234 [Acanthoscelides obtectus]